MADDHALVLEGLRSLLQVEPDILVIATATDGERLLDAVTRFKPDVAIVDVNMQHMDGITCMQHIREISPETRVLFLTAYTDGQTLQSVMASGADGLLLKTDPPDQTILAIRQVMAGQLVFPAIARQWMAKAENSQSHDSPLSARENEVLAQVAKGKTNIQVAKHLHISTNTVKFHLQNIFQQLEVKNRTEASHWYLKNK